MSIMYVIASIVGVMVITAEGIYGYKAWHDVKTGRATNASHARRRLAFELFAGLWLSPVVLCVLLVVVAFGHFGIESALFMPAVQFGSYWGAGCVLLAMMMARAASKFAALEREGQDAASQSTHRLAAKDTL